MFQLNTQDLKPPALARSLAEITLLVGGAFFMLWHFASLRPWLELNPSPALILAIALSLRYAFLPALAGQLSLSALYLFLQWQKGHFLDLEDMLQFNHLYTPLLGLGLGVWLSISKMEILRRIEGLELAKQNLHLETQNLRHALDCRTETLDELADRLSERGENWSSLQEFGKQILNHDSQAQIRALLNLSSHLLGTKSCAWYKLENDQTLQLDQSLSSEFPPSLAAQFGIAALALQRESLITIAELEAHLVGPEPLQIALGLWNQNQSPLGVLVARDIPFARLHRENMRLLKSSGAWLSQGLYSSQIWQEMQSASIWNPYFQCYNLFYLEQLIDQAHANCRRYGGTFTLCHLKLHYQGGEASSQQMIEAHLLRQFLRSGDIMAKAEAPSEWWLYLPSTPASGAEIALGKLCQQIEQFFEASPLCPQTRFGICQWQAELKPQEIWQQCALPSNS